MNEVKAFLDKTEKLVGKPEVGLTEVKATLEALRKIDFSLVDPKVLGDALASMVESMSRLVDTRKVAVDTQRKVEALTSDVKTLKKETANLASKVLLMKSSFDELKQKFMFDGESQGQRRKKLGVVLEMLEEYLRRHS